LIRTTSITQKVIISASPEEVYNALLDPKKQSDFTGSKATGKAIVGAKFTAWDGYISGKNLELEKGKRIVQQWITTDWPDDYPPSKLEFSLKKVDDKTELTMLHSDIPADQEKELEQGWIDFYWSPLKSFFEKK
jgi:activator of HSP90 ATPase